MQKFIDPTGITRMLSVLKRGGNEQDAKNAYFKFTPITLVNRILEEWPQPRPILFIRLSRLYNPEDLTELFKSFGIYDETTKMWMPPSPEQEKRSKPFSQIEMGYMYLRKHLLGQGIDMADYLSVIIQINNTIRNLTEETLNNLFQKYDDYLNDNITAAFEMFYLGDEQQRPKFRPELSNWYKIRLIFLNRYIVNTYYLKDDDMSREILREWTKLNKSEFPIGNYIDTWKECQESFKKIVWGSNVDDETKLLQRWNQMCIEKLRSTDFANQKVFKLLGLVSETGEIYLWQITTGELMVNGFLWPIPKNFSKTRKLSDVPTYQKWLRIVRDIFSVKTDEQAILIRRRIQDAREEMWNLKEEKETSPLWFSDDLLKKWLTNRIETSFSSYLGVIPVFKVLLKPDTVSFESYLPNIIVALAVLYNIIQKNVLSFEPNFSGDSKQRMSFFQYQKIFQFANEIDYRFWKTWTKIQGVKDALYVPNQQSQMLNAFSMIKLTEFILQILDEENYQDGVEPAEKMQLLYDKFINEWKIGYESIQTQWDETIVPTNTPTLSISPRESLVTAPYLFEYDDTCAEKFNRFVIYNPVNVQGLGFNLTSEEYWPSRILKHLNDRKTGCVGTTLEFIEQTFERLSSNQRQNLINVAVRVGAYINGEFVKGWEMDSMFQSDNLKIAKDPKRNGFELNVFRKLCKAWYFLVKAIVAIGKNQPIDEILMKLDQIEPLTITNGTFVGDNVRNPNLVTINEPVVLSSPLFDEFSKIRNDPLRLIKFENQFPIEEQLKLGLVKNLHGKLVYTTGMTEQGTPHSNSLHFLGYELPDGSIISESQANIKELLKRHKDVMEVLAKHEY